MGEVRYVGQWWLPTAVANRLGGVLTIDSDGRATLEVAGELLGDEDAEVIHGEAAGKHVSLISAFRIDGGKVYGQAWTTTEVIRASRAFIGIHLADDSDARFSAAQFEVANLTAWMGQSGVNRSFTVDHENKVFIRYDVGVTVPESVDLYTDGENQKISIQWKSAMNGPSSKNYGNELSVTETALVRIESTVPQSWDSFSYSIRTIQNLVTLGAQRGCAIRNRKFYVHTEDGDWPVAFYQTESTLWEDSPVRKDRFLFKFSDLGDDHQNALDRWFRLRKKLGLPMDVLFGLDYMPSSYYENELFNAAASAEGIHAALFPDVTGIDPQLHAQRVAAALAGVEDRETERWIRDKVGTNGPGLKRRYLELAERPDSDAVKYLLADVDSWAKWLRNARNAVGHLNTGQLEKSVPEKIRHRLADATRALLHLVLLQELQVSAEVQRQGVRRAFHGIAHAFGGGDPNIELPQVDPWLAQDSN